MPAIGVHTVTKDDTGDPLDAKLIDKNGNPYDLASYTVKAFMELPDGTSELAVTTTGVSAHPTQTFTAEADDEYITANAHGVEAGDQIIVANSGGDLPTGLAASTRYWPINITANRFQVAAYDGGKAIALTSDGSGTNTFYIVGHVRFTFAAANVDTAQTQRLWFTLTSGSDVLTEPKGDQWFEIRVVAAGN